MAFVLPLLPELFGATGLLEGGLFSTISSDGLLSTIGNVGNIFSFLNPFHQSQPQSQSSGLSFSTMAVIGIGGIVILTLLIK